jgi:oligopeptide/dipeptide ABC transporter ATP-binding protein
VGALVEVEELSGYFLTYAGPLHVLNGVTFALEAGKITGLVGETGSGKSITALAMLRLLPGTFVRTAGTIRLSGADLFELNEREMQQVRGRRISIVFQDARAALNPVFSVGEQLERVAQKRAGLGPEQARTHVIDILTRTRVPDPRRRVKQYVHELSGGMAQRVMIAMALIPGPTVLILDEPTTGLDVTIQAEIMDLVRGLVRESGLTTLLITHDLGVVAETCDAVAVMYAGQIVEYGTAEQIFRRPAHPYTAELLRASLSVDSASGAFYSIPGAVPDLHTVPPGCLFAPRCPRRADVCQVDPPVVSLDAGHLARCHFALEFSKTQAPLASAEAGT